MKRDTVITQDSFNRLLEWLDTDRSGAGVKYEEIRRRLIKVFVRRGCSIPEELADETIDRVCGKIAEFAGSYVGDPVAYFCGVAHNVFLEYVKKRPVSQPPAEVDPPEGLERRHQCLDGCMEHLDVESRELILQYYREDKRAKIYSRKQLADELGIELNTLRMRAHRIRTTLQECVRNCVAQAQA